MAGETDKDKTEDPFSAFGEALGKSAQQWQEQWQDGMNRWLEMFPGAAGGTGAATPPSMPEMPEGSPKVDPAKLLEAQMELMQDFQALWASTTARLMGQEADPVVAPEPGDHRFRDSEWTENPVFDFLKQSYLLNARWLQRTLADVEGLDKQDALNLDFMGRQIVDAFSPANFALTNPAVLREMRETNGESLMRGLQRFGEDLKDAENGLQPKQVDMDAFEVGVNLATAPGAVVYRSPVMELIQYAPTTETVYEKPLLIIPPWINKFYVLDLQPENSFIRWTVDQGYTVFIISWVNPDESHAKLGFDDYVRDGLFAALSAIESATGAKQSTAIGYCIGGTLLSATLAHMGANGDERIGAATFFAAQADFQEAGDLLVFTDEKNMEALERQVREKGYLDGANMAATFNAMRANDLIWYFVINNYLMGKEPPAFDLLYWNADSTHFPAEMFIDYLRNMYQQNNLAKPGGFKLLGQPVDLGDVKIPTYIQAGKEDHIAPPSSVFKLTQLFSGQKRFMLAGSGHIAGVINPPAKNKYQHWLVEGRKSYPDLEAWLADAVEHPGSWWPDWDKWLSRRSGKKVPARVPGDGGLPAIEPAPGSYVKVRR